MQISSFPILWSCMTVYCILIMNALSILKFQKNSTKQCFKLISNFYISSNNLIRRKFGVTFLFSIGFLVGCGGGNFESQEKYSSALSSYELLLNKFPSDDPGTGRDFYTEDLTEQAETLAFVLKSEAILGRVSSRSRNCISRLLALSDLDLDGISGWGIDFSWDAFGDGSINDRNQVYLVTNAIVLDGLLMALQAGIVEDDHIDRVRTVVVSALLDSMKSFTKTGNGGYFWYSNTINDAINVPNVSAYLAGIAMKAINSHNDWFTPEQKALILDNVDRSVRTLLTKVRYAGDGAPYWAYVDENFTSPNDLVHHGYTVLGLWTYQTFGGAVALPFEATVLAKSFHSFVINGKPTEYQQNLPGLDSYLRSIPTRVWAVGFAVDVLVLLQDISSADLFLDSLKSDYGVFPNVRYTPLALIPAPTDIFYSRTVSHVLPGLARMVIHHGKF